LAPQALTRGMTCAFFQQPLKAPDFLLDSSVENKNILFEKQGKTE